VRAEGIELLLRAWVDYILIMASNWKMPIRDFEATGFVPKAGLYVAFWIYLGSDNGASITRGASFLTKVKHAQNQNYLLVYIVELRISCGKCF
jgi:hypothetical protein